MGLFSDSKVFSLNIRESATDGSDFTNPDADYRRLFLGEDGLLHLIDSAGNVTTPGGATVATDSIWDAAGDLAVGSGANTAAKLSLGTALQQLRVNSGATALEYFTALTWFKAYKSANEIVNNSAVLQDDNHLIMAVAANEVWEFAINLWYDSGTTPDLKVGFTIPSGATLRWTSMGDNASAGAITGGDAIDGSATQAFFGAGLADFRHGLIVGVILNGATPGNLTMQWAQNTQNASDTTIYSGSSLVAHRLA